jgi:hypothetical protein
MQLSELSGVKAGHISRLENGGGNPKAETVQALAAALGYTAADLYKTVPEATYSAAIHPWRCGGCCYYRSVWSRSDIESGEVKLDEPIGRCHRYAPSPAVCLFGPDYANASDHGVHTVWPTVAESDFCGDFVAQGPL